MRLKRSPLLFLQLSGLYISDIKGKNAWRRLPSLIAPAVLFTITFVYHGIAFYHGAQLFMTNSIQNVEYAVVFGWEFQSVAAAIFMFYWWRTGAIQFFEQALRCSTAENKSQHVVSTEMKATITKYLKVLIVMTLSGTARIVASTVYRYRWIEQGKSITEPTMGLHRFDFVYRFIGIYQLLLLNCVICYFVTSVRCLTFQLQSFNREFKELLRSPTKTRDLPDRLMSAFSSHKTLAKKVRKMDKIFRVFIFCMLVTGVPMAVFGAITLIRRDNLLSFVFAFYDFVFCTVQLIAFSIVPAQLHFELHKVPSSIYWGSAVWTQFDPEVFQIARTFTETVERLKAGLSFGGLVFIRKSSILMAFILIVPYVILSYQLYLESGKMTSYRNNAIQHNQNRCH